MLGSDQMLVPVCPRTPSQEILTAPMVEQALATEGVEYNQSIFTPS